MASPPKRPTLVANAGFAGTLAAVRALGASGVPITVADSAALAPARWSRYATRAVACPPLHEVDRFVTWLLELGRRGPRHVICPTSDELAFALALHREEVDRHFDLHLPPLDVVLDVLDKKRLYAHAEAVGIDVPRTFFAEDEAGVERAAREANGPVILKPRTQIQLDTKSKGALVSEPGALAAAYAGFMRDNVYGDAIRALCPDIHRPMIQEFHAHEQSGIYVLAGFYDRDTSRIVALGARKLLQRPRRLGIGLCFEDADADPALVEATARFCERTGYFGIFQLEFLQVGARRLLIDFNPRFYNYLALDTARGLALPQLVYAAACGDAAEVERLMDAVPRGAATQSKFFCNRVGLELLMRAQRLSGRMTAEEEARWRDWCVSNRGRIVDSVLDAGDPMPVAADLVWQLSLAARHPRIFYRSIVLDR